MKLQLQRLWVYILRPIWSFIINVCYWIFNLNNLMDAIKVKKEIQDLKLKELLYKFIWVSNAAKDWIPWIITITNRKWKDDCDGAATLANYWYKKNGIKSSVINLFDSKFTIGHAICVKNDHTEFTSSDKVIVIKNSDNWEKEIFKFFNDEYSIMI